VAIASALGPQFSSEMLGFMSFMIIMKVDH
jgi:hypothetical protein